MSDPLFQTIQIRLKGANCPYEFYLKNSGTTLQVCLFIQIVIRNRINNNMIGQGMVW